MAGANRSDLVRQKIVTVAFERLMGRYQKQIASDQCLVGHRSRQIQSI